MGTFPYKNNTILLLAQANMGTFPQKFQKACGPGARGMADPHPGGLPGGASPFRGRRFPRRSLAYLSRTPCIHTTAWTSSPTRGTYPSRAGADA